MVWRTDESATDEPAVDIKTAIDTARSGQTLTAYAESVGCSLNYLSDVYNGRRIPGKKILNALNLEKEVKVVKTITYRWR